MCVAVGRFPVIFKILYPSQRKIQGRFRRIERPTGRFCDIFKNLFPFSMICSPGLYEKGEQILKNSCKTPECTITSRKSGWFPAFGGNKYEKNAEKRPTGQQTTCWPRLKWYVNPVMLGMLRIPRCRATEESSFPDSERCAFLAAGDQGCCASWPPGK